VRTSDTKYIGNYYFTIFPSLMVSFSMTKAPLIAECVAETYKMKVVLVLDLRVLVAAQEKASNL
jgi:hypothetical protein